MVLSSSPPTQVKQGRWRVLDHPLVVGPEAVTCLRVASSPLSSGLDAAVLKGLLGNTRLLHYFSDSSCTEDSPVDLSWETLRGRRGFTDGLSPPKPKKPRTYFEQRLRSGICQYKRSSAPKTNSISGTIRSVEHSQPGTAKQVCGCRIGQPNTSCQYAWSMHLPEKYNPPVKQLLSTPMCIIQSIPLHKSEGWGSILT